ncbi:MAG: LysM peptidoglycan-binding domain-containing protein [Candidatus Nomurabacteria bacterium]|jgi:surface antigen|nr:LysM peptidoglycan-binding domain-containing protein [Candidatus Nomurabacteria bacterium]
MSKFSKFIKKLDLSWGSLLAYVGFFGAILVFVALGSQKATKTESLVGLINKAASSNSVLSTSQLTEVVLVADLAEEARLPAQTNASNIAFSLILQHAMAQSGDGSLSGSQTTTPEISRGITSYAVKDGDNLGQIAERYGVSIQTLRWSNGIKKEDITVGQTLLIPSVDGFVYTVKSGDTIDGLANKYQSSRDNIVLFNDLELTDLVDGSKIIIPDGVLPNTERPEYTAPVYAPPIVQQPSGSTLRMYRNPYPFRDNSYAYGWCTWYAAERRAEIGRPVGRMWGNASTWAWTAAAQGWNVGAVPQVGAVMANGGNYGGYGHVAIVEEIHEDEGYIVISEMNGPGGLYVVDWRTIPMESAVGGFYRYIY